MGELITYAKGEVFRYGTGMVIDMNGECIWSRPSCASDMVIVDINYTTGRAWAVPCRLSIQSPK